VARSRLVMWLGVFRLSARQLQQRWLENTLIVVGIALGVGVLTTGQALVSFQTAGLVALVAQEIPDWRAVSVRPVRIDVSSQFFGQESLPAVPVSEQVLGEPVQPTLEDLLAVREEVPGVALATVEYGARSATVVAVEGAPLPGPGQPALHLQTVTPDEFAFRGLRFSAGGPFTWDDLLAGRAVLVLEESGARRLFPHLTPEEVIGRTVTEASGTTGTRWQVVGVTEPGGLLTRVMLSQGVDMVLGYVPAASQPWLAPEGGGGAPDPRSTTFNTVYFAPENEALIPQLVAGVEAYFNQKYGPGSVDVRNPQAQREEALAWLRPAVLGILVLAGLGLLIAAINILNLFTARVLRRQRIIGTSMALGATRALIFFQTAGEALFLGLVGSLLGLAVATGLIDILRAVLIQQQGDGSEIVAEIYALFRLGFDDGLLGLAAGMLVSLIFGIYPALLGSRQDPVEALRVE